MEVNLLATSPCPSSRSLSSTRRSTIATMSASSAPAGDCSVWSLTTRTHRSAHYNIQVVPLVLGLRRRSLRHALRSRCAALGAGFDPRVVAGISDASPSTFDCDHADVLRQHWRGAPASSKSGGPLPYRPRRSRRRSEAGTEAPLFAPGSRLDGTAQHLEPGATARGDRSCP